MDKLEQDLRTTPFVFVYGTLKKGYGNWRGLLSDQKYIGEGTTKDRYVLGNVGFPFAFPEEFVKDFIDEDMIRPVLGDVFYVDNETTLRKLDFLEGEGSLYHRRLVQVETLTRNYTCWMYHNLNPYDMSRCYQCEQTPEGDWVWNG